MKADKAPVTEGFDVGFYVRIISFVISYLYQSPHILEIKIINN